jgi:ubiquinone/menaquinone biosynthesis C-methylase UbiE
MTKTIDAKPVRYRELKNAQKYDSKIKAGGFRNISNAFELSAIKRSLVNICGNSALDAPCGTGRIDLLLRKHFQTVVGLDSSEAMLSVYHGMDNTRTGILGDIFHLPFQKNQFDWVICHRLFHHFDADELRISLLKSTARVSMNGIIFYAWVKTPLARRESSRRITLNLEHIEQLIRAADLKLESVRYAFWPFQPKAILTCTKK